MASPTFGAAGTYLAGTSANTAPFAVPAGTANNEIVLVFMYLESTAAVTPPAGFTQKARVSVTSSHDLLVFWKRCTTTDTGTYSFSHSSVWREGVAVRFSGCITSGDPFDATNTNTSTSATGGVTPSVTATSTVTDTIWVFCGTNFNGGAWTPPSGFTERADASGAATVATKDQTAIGSSGGTTATCAGGATGSAAFIGGLKSTTSTSGGTNYDRTPADSVGVTDSATDALDVNRAPADPVGTTDSAATAATADRTPADAAGVTDLATVALSASRTPADLVGATDTAVVVAAADRAPADTAGITDAAALVATAARAPADPVGVTDSILAELGQAVTDQVGVSDTVAVALDAVHAPADTVGITDTAAGDLAGQAVTLLATFALASADPHDITIPGATAGLDVWLLVNTAAVVATPAGWTLEASRVAVMGSYVLHLPAESHPGGNIGVTLDLSGARALSAVAFESAAADASVYASLVAPVNFASTTYGTGAHTFTARDEALAVFMFHGDPANPPASFDVVSLDSGFTEFADTGWAGSGGSGDEAARVVVGLASAVAMSASGVVVTLDVAQPVGSAVGFLAFNLDTGVVKVAADPVGVTDAVAAVAAVTQSAADAVGATDAAEGVQALARAVADPVGVTDTATADLTTGGTNYDRTPADPVGVTDAVTASLAATRTPADLVGATDTAAATQALDRAPADAVGIADTGSPQTLDISWDLADTAGVTDSVAAVQASTRTPADPVGVTDTAAADLTGGITRTAADPVGVTDAVAAVAAVAQSAADAVAVTDQITVLMQRVVTVADLLGLIDSATGDNGLAGSAADPVSITDSTTRNLAGDRAAADPVPVTDALTVVVALARTVADLVGVTDAASTPGGGATWQVSRAATLNTYRALLDGVHPTTATIT